MAAISTRCTHCGQGLTLKKPELLGKQVRCPACKKPFVVKPVASRKKSKPRPSAKRAPADDDLDEILDADIVEDDAGGGATGSDDDWLDALNGLPEEAPTAAPGGDAPPRVKKKKKSSGGTSKKRRGLRDPDGEFPLWLHRVLMVGAGVLAGLVATAIWAGMISKTGSQSRYMATLVGIFVGTAVRLGASKWDFGWGPALTASLIAFVSIFAGKISGYHLLKHQEEVAVNEHNAAYVAMLKHENYPISEIAMEIEEDRADADGSFEIPSREWELDAEERFTTADGSPDWSEIYNPEYFPERYAGVWDDAKKRWEEMPVAEKKKRQQAIADQISYLESGNSDELDESYGDYDTNIYGTKIITPWDFLFSIIAIVAAFKIAAGMNEDEDDTGF